MSNDQALLESLEEMLSVARGVCEICMSLEDENEAFTVIRYALESSSSNVRGCLGKLSLKYPYI